MNTVKLLIALRPDLIFPNTRHLFSAKSVLKFGLFRRNK